MSSTTSLDPTIFAKGQHLFALARNASSTESFLDKKLMELGLSDEHVKAQLFRLVDVLPVLTTAPAINRHLLEYMGSVKHRLPFAASQSLDFFPLTGLLGKAAAAITKSSTQRMARRFIAATDPRQATLAAKRLRAQRMTFTVDLLGEAVLSEHEATAYQAYYLNLITTLADDAPTWRPDPLLDFDHQGPTPRVNVSVKLSALYSQFDPIDPARTSNAVREKLRPILRLAKSRGVFVNVDMEQFSFKNTTLQIFKDVLLEDEFRNWPDVGIAIQAYLQSSGDDLQSLLAFAQRRGTPVWIRLVKGAYWDYEKIISQQNHWPLPVYPTKPQTDANYEAQTAFLMANHQWLRPAIASHNIRSIAAALTLAQAHNVPDKAYEFQLLYGMADPIKQALIKLNQRVRVYAPVGALLPGMAYLVRRLLENTSNESFLRAGFLENVPEERLLMNPMKLIKRKPAPATTLNGDPAAPFQNEPLTDFAQEASRQAMTKALQKVAQTFPSSTQDSALSTQACSYPNIINGEKISSEKYITSINPSQKSQIIAHCAAATPADALRAIAAAKAAFPAWRNTPAATRAALLRNAANIIRRRRFELAAWQVYETAKQWREADADVAEAIDYCEYYARQALLLDNPIRHNIPGEENHTLYEPRGVCVAIAPWNFPFAILLGMSVAALVTGNTVIIKPAEQSAVIGAKFMEVLIEAGFPKGVAHLLNGIGEEIGPTLINHPDIALIAFTGSRSVGLMLQEQASRTPKGQDHIKHVITEMGGKNAIIIDQDADLDEAVAATVASAFHYAGQKCSACSRAIVLAPLYDTFIARIVEATKSLNIGPATQPANTVGPVIDSDAQTRILATIESAKSQARLVYSADISHLISQGHYVPPTVFADVPPDSPLAQEEIFGPVLSILKADDLDHALQIANGTQYALTGGLFSRSPQTIEKVKREFKVGNLYINRKITGAYVERQPFGGHKLSGTGTKAGGPDYLKHFTHPRTITENTLRRGFAPPIES